jgi:radical SAM protein with 4Fe4S-binding SPASM domain
MPSGTSVVTLRRIRMENASRVLSGITRFAHLGAAVVRSTARRAPAPLKLNFCVTYWCQYRCKTCNIWQRKPTDELTTDEIVALVRENPTITWADLTGGEIFLRPDIDDVLEAVVSGWRRLALLHFPTNGFLTDRIVKSVERIAGRGPAHTIVTVSVDGDERLNDEIRGIKGGFRRQIETFNALRRIRGISAVFGVTLSAFNLGRFVETFEACARECPGLTINDVHLNVAQVSSHYYGNQGVDGIRPDPARVRADLDAYRKLRGRARSATQILEATYLRYLDQFLETGRTPMPCHALRSSCFVDPWGVVFPCITYSRPMGRLRDTGMRLDPIWNAQGTKEVQREIWRGQCPQCWTACEAYQSIMGNALAARFRSPEPIPVVRSAGPTMTSGDAR